MTTNRGSELEYPLLRLDDFLAAESQVNSLEFLLFSALSSNWKSINLLGIVAG